MAFGDQILNDDNYQVLSEGIAANSQAISSIGTGEVSGSGVKANSGNIAANSAAITDVGEGVADNELGLEQLSLAHSQTHSELQVVSNTVSTNVANISAVSQAGILCCSQAKSQAQMLYAAGDTSQVQYNESGLLAAHSGFIYDYHNMYLGVGGNPSTTLDIYGDASVRGITTTDGVGLPVVTSNPLTTTPGIWVNTSDQLTFYNGSNSIQVSLQGHTHTETDIIDLDHYTTGDFNTDFSHASLANLAAKNYNDLTGKPNLSQLHTQNTDVSLRSGLLAVGATGHTSITGELQIRVYRQDTEPTLSAKNFIAVWVNTASSDRTYLMFVRGVGDQIAIEMT